VNAVRSAAGRGACARWRAGRTSATTSSTGSAGHPQRTLAWRWYAHPADGRAPAADVLDERAPRVSGGLDSRPEQPTIYPRNQVAVYPRSRRRGERHGEARAGRPGVPGRTAAGGRARAQAEEGGEHRNRVCRRSTIGAQDRRHRPRHRPSPRPSGRGDAGHEQRVWAGDIGREQRYRAGDAGAREHALGPAMPWRASDESIGGMEVPAGEELGERASSWRAAMNAKRPVKGEEDRAATAIADGTARDSAAHDVCSSTSQ
jgi:hypothetical protein